MTVTGGDSNRKALFFLRCDYSATTLLLDGVTESPKLTYNFEFRARHACSSHSCDTISNLDPNSCNGKGQCVDQDECECTGGWSGKFCDIPPCYGKAVTDKDVCSGNGQCIAENTCKCNPGWMGQKCDTVAVCFNRDANDPKVCFGHGYCIEDNVCECHEPWSGPQCACTHYVVAGTTGPSGSNCSDPETSPCDTIEAALQNLRSTVNVICLNSIGLSSHKVESELSISAPEKSITIMATPYLEERQLVEMSSEIILDGPQTRITLQNFEATSVSGSGFLKIKAGAHHATVTLRSMKLTSFGHVIEGYDASNVDITLDVANIMHSLDDVIVLRDMRNLRLKIIDSKMHSTVKSTIFMTGISNGEITMTDTTMSGDNAHAVNINGNSSNVTVQFESCQIESFLTGISVTDTEKVTIDFRSTIIFGLEDQGVSVTNVLNPIIIIRDSEISQVSTVVSIIDALNASIEVVNSVLTESDSHGVFIHGSKDVSLNLVRLDLQQSNFFIQHSAQVSMVVSNSVLQFGNFDNLYLLDSHGISVRLSDCIISNSSHSGLAMDNVTDAVVHIDKTILTGCGSSAVAINNGTDVLMELTQSTTFNLNSGSGISIQKCAGCELLLDDTALMDNGGYAIEAEDSRFQTIVIRSSTISRHPLGGISLRADGNTLTMVDTILSDCKGSGALQVISVNGWNTITASNVNVYGNTRTDDVDGSAGITAHLHPKTAGEEGVSSTITIELENSQFENNFAPAQAAALFLAVSARGKSVSLHESVAFQIRNTRFRHNEVHSGYGAAVAVVSDVPFVSSSHIRDVNFAHNKVAIGGCGSMFLDETAAISMLNNHTLTFENNWAPKQCENATLTCFGINNRDESVCSGGGTCWDFNLCACDIGYFSDDCSVTTCNGTESKSSSVCNSQGRCVAFDRCDCDHGYDRETWCRDPICFGLTAGSALVCSQHCECRAPDQCKCDDGYYGAECELAYCFGILSNETDHVCSAHGTCVSPNSCNCTTDWAGPECHLPVCFGHDGNDTDSVCSSHGKCDAPDRCICDAGYDGVQCELPICFDVVASDGRVCSEHGTCVAPNKCDCVAGWDGDECSNDSTKSSTSPPDDIVLHHHIAIISGLIFAIFLLASCTVMVLHSMCQVVRIAEQRKKTGTHDVILEKSNRIAQVAMHSLAIMTAVFVHISILGLLCTFAGSLNPRHISQRNGIDVLQSSGFWVWCIVYGGTCSVSLSLVYPLCVMAYISMQSTRRSEQLRRNPREDQEKFDSIVGGERKLGKCNTASDEMEEMDAQPPPRWATCGRAVGRMALMFSLLVVGITGCALSIAFGIGQTEETVLTWFVCSVIAIVIDLIFLRPLRVFALLAMYVALRRYIRPVSRSVLARLVWQKKDPRVHPAQLDNFISTARDAFATNTVNNGGQQPQWTDLMYVMYERHTAQGESEEQSHSYRSSSSSSGTISDVHHRSEWTDLVQLTNKARNVREAIDERNEVPETTRAAYYDSDSTDGYGSSDEMDAVPETVAPETTWAAYYDRDRDNEAEMTTVIPTSITTTESKDSAQIRSANTIPSVIHVLGKDSANMLNSVGITRAAAPRIARFTWTDLDDDEDDYDHDDDYD